MNEIFRLDKLNYKLMQRHNFNDETLREKVLHSSEQKKDRLSKSPVWKPGAEQKNHKMCQRFSLGDYDSFHI